MPTLPFTRIALTPELQKEIAELKKDFPAMKESELIKMAISGFYVLYMNNKAYFSEAVFHSSEPQKREMFAELCRQIEARWNGENKKLDISQEEIDSYSY